MAGWTKRLVSIGNLRQPRERNQMIVQLVNRVGVGVKKDAALSALEQARRILGVSPRAEDQDQLNALIQTAAAFSQFDSKRGFEIIEPLIDQFNDLAEAAMNLNGFGQQYFQDGELMIQNGNPIGQIASQRAPPLGNWPWRTSNGPNRCRQISLSRGARRRLHCNCTAGHEPAGTAAIDDRLFFDQPLRERTVSWRKLRSRRIQVRTKLPDRVAHIAELAHLFQRHAIVIE
jgi:hypothetical protein